MRRFVAFAVAVSPVLGCAQKGDPPGTVVIDWKAPQTTSVDGITLGRELGARVAQDHQVVLSPEGPSGDVVFSLHVETVTVAAISAPSPKVVMPPSFQVPLVVSMKLVSEGAWKVSGSCDPPAVGMPAIDSQDRFVYDKLLWDNCNVMLRYKSRMQDLTEGLYLEVRGDGTVKPTFMSGKVVVGP